MKRLLLIVLLFLCLICNYSCKNNQEKAEEEWIKKHLPEFDSMEQIIYYKQTLYYDVKGEIYVPVPFGSLGCRFYFFNYGEEIKLFNEYYDDSFVCCGDINYVHLLNNEDRISITSKKHNDKYGDWALVNIIIGSQKIDDVFMTPLAMKAHEKGDDENCILIQLVSKNKYMNVLFYGGPNECLIVSTCSNAIARRGMVSLDLSKNESNHFWKELP